MGMILLGLHAGLRLNDAANLTWENLIPSESLNLLRHLGKPWRIVVDNARVNAYSQRLIVSVAGEVAIIQHSEPNISFILIRYQSHNKSSLEHCARAAGLQTLVFQVKLPIDPRASSRSKPISPSIP